MIKSIVKYAGLFLLSIFILANLVLGYYGLSSIFLTAIVYFFVWMTGALILKRSFRNSVNKKEYLLLFTTIVASMFTGEMALKYVFEVGLQRQEINGNFFYSLPYVNRTGMVKLIRRYYHQSEDLALCTYAPNTQEIKDNSEFKYLHRYNSLGLRGKEPTRIHDKINIACLGDSFTEGNGTSEDSTWCQILETNLNRKEHLTARKQCINGGTSGSDPLEEYFILEKILLSFKPNVVIVAINTTDISDITKKIGWECYRDSKKPPWWAYIYQFSFITRGVINTFYPINWLFLTNEQNQEEEKKSLEKIEKWITEDYQKLAQKNNFKLIVVLHPMLYELEQDTFLLQPLEEKFQSIPGIKTVNLFRAFKNARQKTGLEYESFFWKIDGHNNSTGYKLWADTLSVETELVLREITKLKN